MAFMCLLSAYWVVGSREREVGNIVSAHRSHTDAFPPHALILYSGVVSGVHPKE